MKSFQPTIVIFRENAFNYSLGEKLYDVFNKKKKIKTHVVAPRGPFPLDYDISFKKNFTGPKKQ